MQSNKEKQKDWACPKCSKVNFAKKKVCTNKSCNEPKPSPPEQPKEEPVKEVTSVTSISELTPGPSLESRINQLNISQNVPSNCKIETSSNPKKLYEGTRGKKCTLEVNYVELNLQNLIKTCYHYDVAFVPDSPKKLLPIALDEFMRKYFKGFFYGFDGQKNMITNRKLTIDNSEFDELTKNVEAVSGDRKRSFDVKVKLVSEDNMDVLKNYKNDEKPVKANQNLDIILKSVFRQPIANNLAVRAGRNIFFVPKERPEYLGDGMDLWYGLFQSAILGREKVYLNVDVMHKAFPSQVHLLDHIKVQDRNRQMRIPEYLDDENLKKLNSFLKMLTIGYRLNPNEPLKTYGFNGIGEPASKAKFEHNGKMMTVEEYFAKEKNIRLRFPNLPVLWVGSKAKKIYLPLEFCEIPPGQVTNKTCTKTVTRNMIKKSVTTPDIRKDKIRHSMEKLPYKTDPTIKAFGVQVDDKLQNVGARVIDPPILNYLDGPVKPFGGAWRERTFLEVERNCIKWCILNGFKPDFISKINVLKNTLIQEAKNQKITLEDFRAGDIITMRFAGNKNKVEDQLVKLKHLGYQFVLAVVSSDDDYQVVKNKAELCVGILTTCIDKDTIEKRLGGNNSTVKNILIKLNAKLNGKMHEVDESSFKSIILHGGTMFIGADVTHPSPDQRNIPSIVGVVSSYDQFGTKYFPSWRLQKHGEMIQDLEEILLEHLKIYRDTNNKLPHKIMYYRDGVSDSEFEKVLNVEMAAIRKAMQRIYGLTKPAEVTFIVVQKRHRTRFFPTDPKFADRNGNILPGTIVDKDIVHPFQFQFFLASHTSLQGVTKPSKYCILVNESKISADDIQAITYDLCHLFSRCSRSVSYPAPTYYAHLLADRAKQYFDEDDMRFIMEDIDRANQKYQNNLVYQKFVRESPMFFI